MGESPDSWLRLGAELAAEFGGGLRYWLRVAPFGWVLALMPLVIARMARAELSTAEAVALGTGSYPEATRMQVLARLSSGSLSASRPAPEGVTPAALTEFAAAGFDVRGF